MKSETKTKGLITELQLQCQLYFIKLGYDVLIPLGDNSRYDIVIDLNKNFTRIYVKTCRNIGTGIQFSSRSSRSNTKKVYSEKYSKEEIDYFATYYNGKCYLIPVEECSYDKTLSFSNKKVNQYPVSFIDDYEAEKQIEKFLKSCGREA